MPFWTYIIAFAFIICTGRAFYNTYLVLSGKSIQKYKDYGEYEPPHKPETTVNPDSDIPDIEKYT